jgi:hypothetical protein
MQDGAKRQYRVATKRPLATHKTTKAVGGAAQGQDDAERRRPGAIMWSDEGRRGQRTPSGGAQRHERGPTGNTKTAGRPTAIHKNKKVVGGGAQRRGDIERRRSAAWQQDTQQLYTKKTRPPCSSSGGRTVTSGGA